MSSRRTIKKLMAAGIQRNDAAAFLRTYHRIKTAGMTNLFPEMDTPIPEPHFRIHQETIRPLRLSTRYSIDRMELQRVGAIDFERYIKKRLTDSIVHEIREGDAIKFTKHEAGWQIHLDAQLTVLPPVYVDGRDVRF
jgi:hypothetical protein